MKKTFVVGLVAVVCSAIGCDEDKKPAETTPSAEPPGVSAAAATPPPAPKPPFSEVVAKALEADVAAWNAHDAAKVGSFYTASAKLVQPGLPDAAGHDGIVADAKNVFGTYSDFKVAVTRSFLHDKTLVFQWVFTGKNDGPLLGQKPSGRQAGVAGVSVATLDDEGLIREEHRYFDFPTLHSQLDPKAKAGTFRPAMTLPTGAIEEHVSKGTPEEAKTLDEAKAIYAAFEKKGGMDSMAFVTDDSVFDDYTMPATMKGPKPIKEWVGMFWTAVPDLTQTKPVQFVADDYVVTEGKMTGTQKGPMGPLKATNKPVSMRFVDVFQMKDGKAAHLDTYADMAEILEEIGAMPAPGAAPAPAPTPAAPGAPAARAN